MPGMAVVRPCDGAESAEAWRFALERNHGPTGLVLSRQKVAAIDRSKTGSAKGLHQGGYVLSDAAGFKAIVMSSGSEVQFALAAQQELQKQGIAVRVVSLPCWEAFRAQPQAYRDQVLPPNVSARVSIEAGVTFGWREWLGDRGIAIGVDRYGASAPWEVIYEKLGLTSANVVAAVKKLVG
jgi:transketolase